MPSGAVQNFTPVNPKEHWVYTRSTPRKRLIFKMKLGNNFFSLSHGPAHLFLTRMFGQQGGLGVHLVGEGGEL